MRTWQRSPRRLSCGACSGVIAIGDPLCVLTPRDGGSWRKFRCQTCEGPVPADLPDRVEHLPTRTLTPLRELTTDWKAKASGS